MNSEIFIKKMFLLIAAGCVLSGIFYKDVRCEPVDESIIQEIEYFSMKAFGEEDYRLRFERFYAKKPSRLDWARYFNEVAWRIESKNIYLTRSEEERFDKIVKYFDREYLLIKTASSLEQVPRVKLGAEFSINGEYGWGEDVATSVLSLYQQLRITLEARKKNLFGRLSLRNFGFWGVNDYSSGSVGIDFKTSDPPSVEELWVEAKGDDKGWYPQLVVGRRYFKYGIWGLAVNRMYQPIDMAEISYKSGEKGFFEASLSACSKYENADYFVSKIEVASEDFGAGVAGVLSSVSEKVMATAGVDENEQAASLWFRARPFEGFTFKSEGGIYKRKPDESESYPVILESEVIPSSDVEIALRYGRIPEIKFPSYTQSRPPLDYYPKEYIGTRFSPKTEGYNGIIALKYAAPFIVEIEYTSLKGISEEVNYSKGAVRGIIASSSGSGNTFFDRFVAELSTSAIDTSESDAAEYRFITQCAFRF